MGDLSYFRIDPMASSGTLRLDAPEGISTAWMATRHNFTPVVWEWYFRQAFAPSDNNRAWFYLNSDIPENGQGWSGLAVRTGESGTPKHFRLMKAGGRSEEEWLKSDIHIEPDTGYRIRLVIHPDNELHLYIADGINNTPLLQSEKVSLESLNLPLSGHFGFKTHFTSTRRDQFFWGDITISGVLPKACVNNIHFLSTEDSSAPYPETGTTLQLTFNLPVDTTQIHSSLFRLDDHSSPDKITWTHPQVALLHFEKELEPGLREIQISSWPTLYKTYSEAENLEFFIPQKAKPGDVILNEILYQPDASRGHVRFVELWNRSNTVFDIQNWKIGRSLGSPYRLGHKTSEPLYLMPNDKMVFSETGLSVASSDIQLVELSNFPSFSRFGDRIHIYSDEMRLIDSVSYSPDWGGNRNGFSIERIDPLGASNDPANWKEHPDGHSAGLKNRNFNDQPGQPFAHFAGLENEHRIRISFNRFVRRSSLEKLYLNHRPLSLVSDDNSPELAAHFIFSTEQKIKREQKNIDIKSFMDTAGREKSEQRIPLSFPPKPGELILNEIMYQPLSERYSRKNDQSQYVEIFNRSELHLQMEGLHLHDRPDKHGKKTMLNPLGTNEMTLPPDHYAVFFPDSSDVFERTRIFQAFSIPASVTSRFFRIDRLTLGISTQGDEIYLSSQDGTVLDSLWFQPSWHNPGLIDVRGISLERIHPDVDTGNPSNWTSNTTPEGGTPGYANSVKPQLSQKISYGLQLEPNPFSPSGNDSRGHLFIRYSLDEPDYLMRVRVFDRQGRYVATLADGERAGFSGSIIWDGRDYRGIKGRTGLYVIFFEAYHSALGKKKEFRTVAVLVNQ